MKAADNQVEVAQSAAFHVPVAARIQVQFDGAQHAEFGMLFVDECDLVGLLQQLLFVDATGDLQSFGVVRDRDVLIAALDGGSAISAMVASPSLHTVCICRSPRTEGSHEGFLPSTA